jgi:hypothetical protein
MSGITEAARGFLYVDANPIAYSLEGPEERAVLLKKLFGLLKLRPGAAVTSELTLAEVLPKKRIPDRYFFDLLIWSNIFDLRPITRDILVETARYRSIAATPRSDGGVSMPKLPDAIHVVTAVTSGCRSFLSSDSRIRLPETIRLIHADAGGIESLIKELA